MKLYHHVIFQVRKLVQKLVSRDTLNYRKITDKALPKDAEKKEGEEKTENKDEPKEGGEELAMTDEILAVGRCKICSEFEKLISFDVIHLIKNVHFLFVKCKHIQLSQYCVCFVPGNKGLLGVTSQDLEKTRTRSISENVSEVTGDGEASGMVMYKGSLLDIASVMQRLEKSEKARQAAEDKFKETQEDLGKFTHSQHCLQIL